MARIVHSTRSPLGWPPSPEMAEFFRNALPSSLGYLDDQLADGRPFLAGAEPTIADCTLAAGLQLGRFGELAIDPEFENLTRWDAAYRERPTAKAVLTL